MTASIWEPGSTPALNSDASTKTQRFVAVADQIIFNLTEFTYTVGIDNLLVYKNGLALAPGVDFFESTASSFTLAVAADLDDEILALGFVGVTGEVPVSILTQEDVISSAAALRAYGGTLDLIFLKGTATPLDGGEGMFQLFSGQAPGTYVDNNLDTIVPAGGDGSAAWRRQTPAMLRSQLELNTVSQAEAEAAVATTTRAWTAERVGQAIVSGINSIVTGGYIAALYEALANTNKYTDAEKAAVAGLFSIIPEQTDHIKVGNRQILRPTSTVEINIGAAVNGVWNTVGPTGSGADFILSSLDDLPAAVRVVTFKIASDINTDSGGIGGTRQIHTQEIGGNDLVTNFNKIMWLSAAIGVNEKEWGLHTWDQVVDENHMFEIYRWEVDNAGSNNDYITYRGFMSD